MPWPKEEKLACLLGSSRFIEKKESAFGFWIWLLWSWQEKNWNCWGEPPLKQKMSMPFQTNNPSLFSVSKRFMWVPAMQWFHLAVFHNYSVFTPPSFATEAEESLALSDLMPSVLPSCAGSSSHIHYLGGQKSLLCFHFTRDLIAQSSLRLPQGLPEQTAIGSALWGEQSLSFIHLNSLYSVGSFPCK